MSTRTRCSFRHRTITASAKVAASFIRRTSIVVTWCRNNSLNTSPVSYIINNEYDMLHRLRENKDKLSRTSIAFYNSVTVKRRPVFEYVTVVSRKGTLSSAQKTDKFTSRQSLRSPSNRLTPGGHCHFEQFFCVCELHSCFLVEPLEDVWLNRNFVSGNED